MSTAARVREAIEALREGDHAFFLAEDLYALGSTTSVHMQLSRLVASGRITRVSVGLYSLRNQFPQFDSKWVDDLALTVARKTGARVAVEGRSTAADLGFISGKWIKHVYPSDTALNTTAWAARTVELKRVRPALFDSLDTPGGRIAQALYWLGPKSSSRRDRDYPVRSLTDREFSSLSALHPLLPPWMWSLARHYWPALR